MGQSLLRRVSKSFLAYGEFLKGKHAKAIPSITFFLVAWLAEALAEGDLHLQVQGKGKVNQHHRG